MKKVVKSLVVDFANNSESTQGAAGILRVEFDDREPKDGGLNIRTTPVFSDKAYFLVYSYLAANIEVKSSSGVANFLPTLYYRTVSERLTFSDQDTAETRYPIDRIKSYVWVGNPQGEPIATGGSVVTIDKPAVAVLDIEYTVAYQVITLTPPVLDPNSISEFEIALVVSAEEILEGVSNA
ncbi:hypothetical protein [Vibrio phage LV6]|nr:hypothetical protein [Vibrio phage LV6]